MNQPKKKAYKINFTWDKLSFLIYMIATLLILSQGILLSRGYISKNTSSKIIFPCIICILLLNVVPVLKQDWRNAFVYTLCVVVTLICGIANFML